ncbi:MAG: hypothetical protein K8T26_01595 [Lentisphaerae bacterium]|nr:hypothetical protein [Lentisphaerota bacterium]
MSTASEEVEFTPQEHEEMAMQSWREGRRLSEVLMERLAEKEKAMANPPDESTGASQPSMA